MNKVDLSGANCAEQSRIKRNTEVGQPVQAESPAHPTAVNPAGETDKLSVSERGTTIGRLAARAAELPDVRQERVEQLRQLVQSGSYNPSANDIADAIFKDEK